MLTLIEDLPEGVVGVEAHGKVTSKDYERELDRAREWLTSVLSDQERMY
jgi:hypothetical protein